MTMSARPSSAGSASNVIPGAVVLSLDVRHARDARRRWRPGCDPARSAPGPDHGPPRRAGHGAALHRTIRRYVTGVNEGGPDLVAISSRP